MSEPIIIDARVGNVRLEIAIRVVEGEARVRGTFEERVAGPPAPAQQPARQSPPQASRPPSGGGGRPSIIPELNALREELGLDSGAGSKAIGQITGSGATLRDIEEWLAAERGRTLRQLCELAADILDRQPRRQGGGGYGGRR